VLITFNNFSKRLIIQLILNLKFFHFLYNAYAELVQDSAKCLKDNSVVNTDVRDRDMADGEGEGN
jgi:hypothetical protein